MARLIPDDWKNVAATGAAERERETLALLEAMLPAHYTVYHGVHWTRLNRSFSVFGEADFAIVSPAASCSWSKRPGSFGKHRKAS